MDYSSFPTLRRDLGHFLVDKTKLIENIVDENCLTGLVDLVLRPRHCGKSTMLQTLKSFFSIPRDNDDLPQQLFKGLHITSRQDICTEHMGKYPVIFCNFKDLTGSSWEGMLSTFKQQVSCLYKTWKDCLMPSLTPDEKIYFESICFQTATTGELKSSLYELSYFLKNKFNRKVIVTIDEFEAPINCAFEYNYLEQANEFLMRGVLPPLLKSNKNLQYAVLAGVAPPVVETGWYSGLNNIMVHALHTRNSVFAGMLMFMETEVIQLKTLSGSDLEIGYIKAHYNSYMAAGHISVYNPVSIMTAFQQSNFGNFGIATGKYPLLKRGVPDHCLKAIYVLLVGGEIEFELQGVVTFGKTTLGEKATLPLLYYAGYLTMTANNQFKIPNQEVMAEWVKWIVDGDANSLEDILKPCVDGPISKFEIKWPDFMQQLLYSRLVGKERGAVSHGTPEKIYRVYFLGLMHSLGSKGWEVCVGPQAGGGFVDIRLLHKSKHQAILIELKSSQKEEDMEKDADNALEQVIDKNYRLPNIHGTLRAYGIATFHLSSHVKGRYLELNGENQWVERDDPAMSIE